MQDDQSNEQAQDLPVYVACPNADGCDGMIYGEWVERFALRTDGTHDEEPMHEGEYVRWACTSCRLSVRDPRAWLRPTPVLCGHANPDNDYETCDKPYGHDFYHGCTSATSGRMVAWSANPSGDASDA